MSWPIAEQPASVDPATTARMVAKATARNEAEQNRAADRMRKMDRRHVRTANKVGDLVELARSIDAEIA